MDGVLCDTAKYHYLAWKSVADALGIDFDKVDNEQLKGVSRMASLDILLSKSSANYTQEQRERFAKEKNCRYIQWFDYVVDGTSVKTAKPDPEVYLKSMWHFGVHPQECIVFEDAQAGIDTNFRYKHSPLLVRCALGRARAMPQSTKDWDTSAPCQEHTALRIE